MNDKPLNNNAWSTVYVLVDDLEFIDQRLIYKIEKSYSLAHFERLKILYNYFVQFYNSFAQKKYLIESKQLFVWNTFFDVKKCFV